MQESAAPFLEFLSEPEAQLRGNKSRRWLALRFAAWERQGMARLVNGRREYLRAVIPHEVDVAAVRADAKREAGGAA